MKSINYFFLLVYSFSLAAQGTIHSNVQNENNVQNTYFMRFSHQADPGNTGLEAKAFFKPYLAYGNNRVAANGENKMMDSFVFYDGYYAIHHIHWNGIYNIEKLEYYLDNVFTRTKLPIVDNVNENNLGILENKDTPSLSYKMLKGYGEDQLLPLTTYQVDFKLKRHAMEYHTNCFDETVYGGVKDKIWEILENPPGTLNTVFVGIQYLDENCDLVDLPNNCINDLSTSIDLISYSSSYKMCLGKIGQSWWSWFTGMSGEIPTDEFIPVSFQFQTPADSVFDFSKFVIVNARGFEKEILVDSVQIRPFDAGVLGENIINDNDSNFNIIPSETKWEYVKKFSTVNNFLFHNRESLIDELRDAKVDLGNSETTKIILTLPKIDYRWNPCLGIFESYYFNDGSTITNVEKSDSLKKQITYYIDGIVSRFNAWKLDNPNAHIEIAGLYYGDEDVPNTAEYNFLEPFLNHTKAVMPASWQLYGSPFIRKHIVDLSSPSGISRDSCFIKSSFADEAIHGTFDVSWVQPGAFFNSNVDRDFIGKVVLDVARPLKTGVNVESRVLNFAYLADSLQQTTEDYAKVQDYYDYNTKLGAINYPKVYFDDGGAHYKNSQSTNPAEKIDYDNLHQFIRNSQKGILVNNGFEHEVYNDSLGLNRLFNWQGDYDIMSNNFSTTLAGRQLEFKTTVDRKRYDSDFFPVTAGDSCILSLQAKELAEEPNNSGLFGVAFYTNDDDSNPIMTTNTIGDLTYSPFLDVYFSGAQTTSEFQTFRAEYVVPEGAVKMKLFILRYGQVDVHWKDLKIQRLPNQNEPDIFYADTLSNILLKENRIKNGTASLRLNYSKYAEVEERISINNKRSYQISIDVKEELPLLEGADANKALIGFKAFGKDGLPLTAGSHVSGLNYGSGGDTFWTYISNVNQDWSTFKTNEIGFSTEVASIQLIIRNWFYQNTLLFDNVTLGYFNDAYVPNRFPADNLLAKEKWNEAFPITTTKDKPVYYNELINVKNMTSLSFSAHFKDESSDSIISASSDRFFGVECLDENYNMINSGESDSLYFSDEYHYWVKELVYETYETCELISYNGPRPNVTEPKWFYNQWQKIDIDFSLPSNKVKWIRLLIHNNGVGSTRMLNPILLDTSSDIDCESTIILSGNAIITQSEYVQDSIVTNGIVVSGATVEFAAGTCIHLLEDFEVEQGGVFHGYIDSCSINPVY